MTSSKSTISIRPPQRWIGLNLSELWEYRDLLYLFVWRNLKIRYKQTILGASWAVIQPFFTMVVFSIFFGELAGISSDGIPYPVFAYAALVPWMYFSNAVSQASSSLTDQEEVLTKIYYPRLIAPVASILTGIVDFSIAFAVLLVMMLVYGILPTGRIWLLPFFVLLAMAASLGVGLWLSALNVSYRDVRHAVPFLLQFWLFSTPVAYSSQLVPASWQTIYGLNPMVGVVEGFRWALLNSGSVSIPLVLASTGMVGVLIVSGFYYFRHTEQTLADII